MAKIEQSYGTQIGAAYRRAAANGGAIEQCSGSRTMRIATSPLAWFHEAVKRGRVEAHSTFGDLSVDLASYLLERNGENRPLRQDVVIKYACDIVDGRWAVNGEPVIISDDGFLNDGQHRCHGVVEAGIGIRTNFVFGVPRESRRTIDQGIARTVGHCAHMNGEKNANHAAAIASYLWQYEKFGLITRQTHRRPTRAQTLEILALNSEEIQKSITASKRKGVDLIGKASLVGFCHFVLARLDREPADMLVSALIAGANLEEDSTIFACRNRLLRPGVSVEDRAALIFMTWNSLRSRKKCSKLQLPTLVERELRRLPAVR